MNLTFQQAILLGEVLWAEIIQHGDSESITIYEDTPIRLAPMDILRYVRHDGVVIEAINDTERNVIPYFEVVK